MGAGRLLRAALRRFAKSKAARQTVQSETVPSFQRIKDSCKEHLKGSRNHRTTFAHFAQHTAQRVEPLYEGLIEQLLAEKNHDGAMQLITQIFLERVVLDAPAWELFLAELLPAPLLPHDWELACRIYCADFQPSFHLLLLLRDAVDSQQVCPELVAQLRERYMRNYRKLVGKAMDAQTLDRLVESERYRQTEENLVEEAEQSGAEASTMVFGSDRKQNRRKAAEFLRQLEQDIAESDEEEDSDLEEIIIDPKK